MSEIIQDKVNQINLSTKEIDSLYHQAALKLGVSDCVLFVLYMLHTNDGNVCSRYLQIIWNQQTNSQFSNSKNWKMKKRYIWKNVMENRRWYILLKKEKHILPRQLHDYLRH